MVDDSAPAGWVRRGGGSGDAAAHLKLHFAAKSGNAGAVKTRAHRTSKKEANETDMVDKTAARIRVSAPEPPQPVDRAVAAQIAEAVHQWSTESPLGYHYFKEEGSHDAERFAESNFHKPQKLVAMLSHNYTPAALKKGLSALKGRDRVLGNLLAAARRIPVKHATVPPSACEDGGLQALCAEAILKAAGADDMNNLDPKEYDVLRRSLNMRDHRPLPDGAGSRREPREPYEFDVFLTLVSGVECSGEAGIGTHTTGPLIPLLPGDPGVFPELGQMRKTSKVEAASWHPAAFDGVEIESDLDFMLCWAGEFGPEVPSYVLDSLDRAGLDIQETPKWEPECKARWEEWEREVGVDYSHMPEQRDGDLFIKMNELLLCNEEALACQEDAAIQCTSGSYRGRSSKHACSCNKDESRQSWPDDPLSSEQLSEEGNMNKQEKLEFLGNGPQYMAGWR